MQNASTLGNKDAALRMVGDACSQIPRLRKTISTPNGAGAANGFSNISDATVTR